MSYGGDPQWLNHLSRRMRWLAIPNLAMGLIGLQAVSFLFSLMQPGWILKIILIPELVWRGEFWRLISFIAIPLSTRPISMLFTLLFGYSILNSIVEDWGDFKTTFYLLFSIVLSIAFSLIFGYPVTSVSGFASTLFLAAATLFPENQIQLYFIPVKMKVLGWIAGVFVLYQFGVGSWMDRAFLFVIYSNYFLFFGPMLVYRIKEHKRRQVFKNNWKR